MRRWIGFVLAAGLLVSATGWAAAGGDGLSGHWSEPVVREAIRQGWIEVAPDGPDMEVTRAQAAAILTAALGRAPAAADAEPDRAITRAEVAVMLVQAMGRDAEARFRDGYTLPFVDAHGSRGYLEVAAGSGIITGFPDGTLRPDQPATWAQAVVMAARARNVSLRVRDPLSSADEWEMGRLDAFCGTPDTRPLRLGVQTTGPGNYYGTPVPLTGGVLKVFVHNHSNICGGEGSPITIAADDLALRLVPYGDGLLPVAAVSLPPLPLVLQPGDQATVLVTLKGWIPPGRYLAEVVGTLRAYTQPGDVITPSLPGYWEDPKGATRLVHITDGPLASGETTASTRPVPVIGGVSLPLESAAWGVDTVVRVNAPQTCGPGTDRTVRFDEVQTAALGDGFATWLGGWRGFAAPGETTSILTRAQATVMDCATGAVIERREAAWQVDIK